MQKSPTSVVSPDCHQYSLAVDKFINIQRWSSPSLGKVCRDDIGVFTTSKQLVSEWQQTKYCAVQLVATVAEDVNAELKTFTVITFIVGELDECHYLSQSVKVLVTFLWSLAV